MVFYLKYRPQTIKELDLKNVRERLAGLVSSVNIPHAFLFVGPKGTGKTSSARIIAKIINCQNLASSSRSVREKEATNKKLNFKVEPCNTCDTCVSIIQGRNIDILEIDAASNRGIDEIRSLRSGIKLSPVSSRAKVYIIDEVHMLTREAFNALLKTIEEPPNHAYFILATTEPKKLPETIVSRCFLVEFNKATDEEIIHALQRVAHGEKLKVDKQTFALIAQYSDGSFRDAVKILEEVSLTGNTFMGDVKRINIEQVQKVIGVTVGGERKLLEHLSNKQIDEALEIVQVLNSKGINFSLFTKSIINLLHKQLLSHYGVSDQNEKVTFSVSELTLLMRRLSRAVVELKSSTIPCLPLEMAIIEWIEENSSLLEKNKDASKEKVEPKVNQGQQNTGGEMEPHGLTSLVPPNALAGRQSRTRRPFHNRVRLDGLLGTGIKNSNKTNIMDKVIKEIKTRNHSLAGVLRGCKQLTINEDTVIIETHYRFHYDRLREPKVRRILEEVVSKLLEKSVKVKPLFTGDRN